MVDGFEPHDTFNLWVLRCTGSRQLWTVGEVYPGWCRTGGAGRVLYRYPTSTIPGPVFSIFLRLRPYPRPNEANFRDSMRFFR